MTEWRVIELDPKAAAIGSLPATIVVPEDAPELAEGTFTRPGCAAWAAIFVAEAPEAELAPLLRPLIEKEPHWERLGVLLEAEDWSGGLPVAERICEIDPADAAARFNLASCLRNVGRREEALALLETIADVFAGQGLYDANVARTLEELGRTEEAADRYAQALALLPEDPFILDRLAALGRLVPAQDEEGNLTYVTSEQFEDAVREDIAEHLGDADHLAGVAEAMLGAGRPQLALSAAGLALDAQPGNVAALIFRGIAEAHLGNLDAALADVDAHLALEPNSALGRLQRAHILNALGRTEEAATAARATLELDPNAVDAVQVLLSQAESPEAALEIAQPIADEHPDAWGPQLIVGDLKLALEEVDQAAAHWELAVELGAPDEFIANTMAALGERHRIDLACRVADAIPRIAGRDPGLRWNVATVYAEAGRVGEARIVYASIAHDQAMPPDMRAAAEAKVGHLD